MITFQLHNFLTRKFTDVDLFQVLGSDEDNFPLTRLIQRHLWIHQHPQNCNHPSQRFLFADWERLPGFGIGAQLAGMAGLLAIAINENRILVTGYYNRADHGGCQGVVFCPHRSICSMIS